MISANVFVNITMFILLVVFFRKIISRFIDTHVSNEPILFGSRYLRGTDTDLVITSNTLDNPKRSRKVTYNLWLNLENVSKSTGDIQDKVIFSQNDGNYKLLYNAQDSTLKFKINNKESCEIVVPQQKWFNLNIGLDGTIVDMYIDSELERSVRVSSVPPIPSGKLTIICKQCTQKSGKTKVINNKSGVYGYIDIFRYYNRYIEPDRVKEIYESGKPDKESNPSDNAFWWL